ncbi:hypothetical protein C8R47DRAFT_1228972 [Mycena vitilis]|nr:hypothetical protein C8R47DRAFT_1228972 [Mycena vitilis]
MPLRKLRNLSNLNQTTQHASPNTAKTQKQKKRAQKAKENVEPDTTSRPKKLRRTRRVSKDASSSDLSSHSASSHKSLPRRVLGSIAHAVSPSRLSRASSCSSDVPDAIPITTPAFDVPEIAGQTHADDLNMPAPPVDGCTDGWETDPRAIDVPEGGDDPSHAYDDPVDPEDETSQEPPITKNGLPWNAREAPTLVMALEALDAINLLLFVPIAPGKRKRTIPTKINGWERNHLEEMTVFLRLYTTADSKTYGEWMNSSIQAAIGKGKGGRYGHARIIRERARKYIFEREVPV